MAHVRQMKRQRVVRNMEGFTQRPGWYPEGTMFDHQTEHPQAGILRQRIKGGKGFINIYMSRLVDIL